MVLNLVLILLCRWGGGRGVQVTFLSLFPRIDSKRIPREIPRKFVGTFLSRPAAAELIGGNGFPIPALALGGLVVPRMELLAAMLL